jgi:hypothetical protein
MVYKIRQAKARAIKDAIAHLNGYVLIVEAQTGFPAIAVKENIKELEEIMKKEKKKRK